MFCAFFVHVLGTKQKHAQRKQNKNNIAQETPTYRTQNALKTNLVCESAGVLFVCLSMFYVFFGILLPFLCFLICTMFDQLPF